MASVSTELFKPQMTTHQRYAQIEAEINERFLDFGYPQEQAEAIARSFTHYMLDYMSEKIVVETLSKAGVDQALAQALAATFSDIKAQTASEYRVAASDAPFTSASV